MSHRQTVQDWESSRSHEDESFAIHSQTLSLGVLFAATGGGTAARLSDLQELLNEVDELVVNDCEGKTSMIAIRGETMEEGGSSSEIKEDDDDDGGDGDGTTTCTDDDDDGNTAAGYTQHQVRVLPCADAVGLLSWNTPKPKAALLTNTHVDADSTASCADQAVEASTYEGAPPAASSDVCSVERRESVVLTLWQLGLIARSGEEALRAEAVENDCAETVVDALRRYSDSFLPSNNALWCLCQLARFSAKSREDMIDADGLRAVLQAVSSSSNSYLHMNATGLLTCLARRCSNRDKDRVVVALARDAKMAQLRDIARASGV